MARPAITLTGDQCREVETLAALLNQEQIADYFGIARNTFRAICDRDPEVLERYKKGKAKAIAPRPHRRVGAPAAGPAHGALRDPRPPSKSGERTGRFCRRSTDRSRPDSTR